RQSIDVVARDGVWSADGEVSPASPRHAVEGEGDGESRDDSDDARHDVTTGPATAPASLDRGDVRISRSDVFRSTDQDVLQGLTHHGPPSKKPRVAGADG